jgi:hypothetical protein
MKRNLVAFLASATLFLASGLAAPPQVKVPSPVVEKQVLKLTSQVVWHSSLESAKAEAGKQNKLIFWLHALGIWTVFAEARTRV